MRTEQTGQRGRSPGTHGTPRAAEAGRPSPEPLEGARPRVTSLSRFWAQSSACTWFRVTLAHRGLRDRCRLSGAHRGWAGLPGRGFWRRGGRGRRRDATPGVPGQRHPHGVAPLSGHQPRHPAHARASWGSPGEGGWTPAGQRPVSWGQWTVARPVLSDRRSHGCWDLSQESVPRADPAPKCSLASSRGTQSLPSGRDGAGGVTLHPPGPPGEPAA